MLYPALWLQNAVGVWVRNGLRFTLRYGCKTPLANGWQRVDGKSQVGLASSLFTTRSE